MQSLEFDWDDENVSHLARHEISPGEAEEVIRNRPCDLEASLRNGEERVPQVGETNAGRVLIVISTMRDGKVRVVTAWPAKERLRRYFQSQKRNGHAGRVEKQDVRE
jgi:uncharacterized DUF497 family protein